MQTITNFRDLGGLTNKNGQRIKPKKLLRSGELSRVSEQEQQLLREAYQLETIVDLRSAAEVAERPDVPFEQVDYLHIDIFKDIQNQGAGLEDFVKIGSIPQAKQYMSDTYQRMILNPSAQAGFAQTIESVLSTNEKNSLLFHCFAGKDRTGISAVLLLEILEIPKATIYQDYLQTNQLRLKENHELLQMAKLGGATEEMLDALNVALTVEPEYLDVMYQTLTTDFGGIKPYLTDTLNISTNMQRELQHLLLQGD